MSDDAAAVTSPAPAGPPAFTSPPAAASALDVRNLTIRYSGVPAVKGITFHLARGESVGLIGPNGAGKTSTLLGLMGVVPSSSDAILLGGKSIARLPPETIVRRGLALVPEGRNIFGGLTVANNLTLGLVGRRNRAGVDESMDWVMTLFPVLRQSYQRPAGLLSGGQQQQLAIARALLAQPDVLMLDEPSLGLAPTAVDTVFDALESIRQTGTSILVVEQRAEFTVAFADRTYVLSDGELIMELTPEAASDTALLAKAYFGS